MTNTTSDNQTALCAQRDIIINNKMARRQYSNKAVYPCMEEMPLFKRFKSMDDCSRSNINMYLATGELNENSINCDNIFNFLEIGRLLKNEKLMSICQENLLNNLHPHCCLDSFQIAVTFSLTRLYEASKTMVAENLKTLCKSEHIAQLGHNVLFDLIKEPEIKEHAHALKAVEHWYEYEKDPRQQQKDKMTAFLKQQMQVYSPCEASQTETLNYQALFSMDNGGNSSCFTVTILECGRRIQKQIQLDEFKDIGQGFAVCCMQTNEDDAPLVFITGGKSSPRSVYRCDIVMGTRKKCSSKLHHDRSFHCMASNGRSLYAIGGIHGGQTVPCIEEYTQERHSWKVVGRLQIPVHSAACCMFDGAVYVFGGILKNGQKSDVIQKYDPSEGCTVVVANLPFPVSKAKATLHMNKEIYIACKGKRLLCFQPKTGQTSTKEAVPVPSKDFALFSDRDELYLTGGMKNNEKSRETYRLSKKLDVWQKTTIKLAMPMSVGGCCVVKIPPQYTNIVPFYR